MARPITVYSHVKTADGTLGVVRALFTRAGIQLADVRTDAGNLELPVGELRRVVDPGRKRLPIEGLPAERPSCAWCARPFRPVTRDEYERAGADLSHYTGRVLRRTFVRWNAYRELFDTLGCALEFAAASHRAGMRRKR